MILNIGESLFSDRCGDGYNDDADECNHHNADDDLHFAVSPPHLSLYLMCALLKHKRVFLITPPVPFRSDAFRSSPSRLTVLFMSLSVLSAMSSLIYLRT